jgi:hypothetical protein
LCRGTASRALPVILGHSPLCPYDPKGKRKKLLAIAITSNIGWGRGQCNLQSAGNEGSLWHRVGAPVFQLRQLVPQGPGDSLNMAAGPVDPVAAGALKEPAVVEEDML